MKLILLLTLTTMLAACNWAPPKTICLESERYTVWVPKATSIEIGVSVGGMKQVTRTRCLKTGPNPRYKEWLEERR